jgi:hypothetical protein
LSSDDLDKFIRFMEKNNWGRIDYNRFLDLVEGSTTKDFNPFKSVLKRIENFLK